jgi:hypothetical protein
MVLPTTTYSLAQPARSVVEKTASIASVQLPDAQARAGAQMQACQTGAAFLAKMPDGSLVPARIVPELSNFSTGDIVIQPL